ncbi:MAG TPA: transcriptional regulator [Thermoanaerobaculia bacterium]|nr:transcriptional regulator [Thermoanaerobaculia bacterium]
MNTTRRKLVTIVTEAVLEKELVSVMERFRVTGYTVTDARGRGSHGVRDAGWELGANIRVEIVCTEDVAGNLVEHLKENYYRDYAMIVFIGEIEVVRPEKF